jgi:flagellar basal-body rod protein FlgB
MSLIDTSELTLLSRFLDLATIRQSILVSNIANVDTPGYRTQDLNNFSGQFSMALAGDSDLPVFSTVRPVSGLLSRPDGNNVSADREGLLLAELQLKYQAATQALKSEFALVQYAIKEGS